MKICVFLSAADLEERYTVPAREFAELLGSGGHTLIWGGSDTGLMKVVRTKVADARPLRRRAHGRSKAGINANKRRPLAPSKSNTRAELCPRHDSNVRPRDLQFRAPMGSGKVLDRLRLLSLGNIVAHYKAGESP
jgi:predicted Rossmann-fold nucleotide-binding protein